MSKYYNQKQREYQKKWRHKKFDDDPSYKEECIERLNSSVTCGFLKKHHDDLKDDPEHLTTEFILNIAGIKYIPKKD